MKWINQSLVGHGRYWNDRKCKYTSYLRWNSVGGVSRRRGQTSRVEEILDKILHPKVRLLNVAEFHDGEDWWVSEGRGHAEDMQVHHRAVAEEKEGLPRGMRVVNGRRGSLVGSS